ncbi:MAG: YciI family protein [Gemmatimonas sp.]
MRKFMLIAYDNVATYSALSPEQMQALVGKYTAWTADIAAKGQLVMGEKLTDHAGQALSKTNGKLSVTEGPYTEANEVVGGFWIVQCETEDEAIAIGASCPHTELGTLGLKEVDPNA